MCADIKISKTCTVCNQIKQIDEFAIYQNKCKICIKNIRRNYYLTHEGASRIRREKKIVEPNVVKKPVGRPRKTVIIESNNEINIET